MNGYNILKYLIIKSKHLFILLLFSKMVDYLGQFLCKFSYKNWKNNISGGGCSPPLGSVPRLTNPDVLGILFIFYNIPILFIHKLILFLYTYYKNNIYLY